MSIKQIDYLIIGQGLCGSFLSYYLLKAGKTVMVIDNQKPYTASKISSGIINPITGRRIVRTWRIEELLPFAHEAYQQFGKETESQIVKECRVIDFHTSLQMKEAFQKKLKEETDYLQETNSDEWKKYFNFYYGAGQISPCLLIDIHTFLKKQREILIEQNALQSETFNLNECSIEDTSVKYKDIVASKIIFCDGAEGTNNPYFKNLPFALNKGEALIVSIPDLPAENIYKQGISIVPWRDGLFWIGSTYEWNFDDDKPTLAFKNKITYQLKNMLKLPFEVTDHFAALRPANVERRPFVGLHPTHINVGILNGMGTKGCSLAPFFARQLADYLTIGTPLYPDADVRRFEKVLGRKV